MLKVYLLALIECKLLKIKPKNDTITKSQNGVVRMQTIQINNPEIESFISSRYGNDTQGLLSDFVKFVKLSLNDGYPAISRDEARRRVAQAVKEVKSNEAVLLSQNEYNKDMEEFLKSL